MPLSFNPAVGIAQLQDLGNVGTAPGTQGALYSIGGRLYFVIRRQIPTATSDNNWCVFKSDATGLIWTLDANVAGSAGGAGLQAISCQSGTKIYMLDNDTGAGPAHTLQVYTYDTTVPGAISGPSAASPTSSHLGFNSQLSLVALNSGTLVAICTDAPNGAGNNIFEAIRYVPGTNTWDAAFTVINSQVSPSGSQSIVAIHDTVTDEVFDFFLADASLATVQLQCVTLSAALAILNTTGNLVASTRKFIETWGVPTISADSNSGGRSVVLPYKTSGNPAVPLNVVFVDINTFATAIEAVDNSADLAAGFIVTPYSLLSVSGWSAIDIGGTLSVFFTADNGNNNNASSQSAVYVKSRVGGVWSAPQQLNLSALSREPSTPYPVASFLSGPAVVFNLFDPTTFPAGNNLATLSSFILLSAGVAPPVFQANQILNQFACGLVSLPLVLECCQVCELDPMWILSKAVMYYAGGDQFTD